MMFAPIRRPHRPDDSRPREPMTSAPARHPRTTRALALLLAAGLLVQVVHYLSLSLPQQIREIPDDSFFYLQIARGFWRHGAFTFDGVTETYGFQPLWQLLTIAVAGVVGDGRALFVAMFATCAALHMATAWCLFRLGTTCFGVVAGVAAALLWAGNPPLWSWSWGLKENALYALLMVVALHRLVLDLRAGPPPLRRSVVFGAVLGLLVFNRVNALAPAVGMLAVCGIAVGLGGGWRARLRHAAIALAVALAVAGPWYGFAKLWFGTAMPTSGTWKLLMMRGEVEAGWQTPWLGSAHVLEALRRWPDYLWMLLDASYGMFVPLLIGAALCWPTLALIRRVCAARTPLVPTGSAPTVWMLLTLAGSAVVSSFSNQLMLPAFLGYARWYAVCELLLVAVVGGALIGGLWRLRSRLLLPAAALALVVGWCVRAPHLTMPYLDDTRSFEKPPTKTQLLELGLWLRRWVPDGATLGIWDPGIVAWYADRRLISFDPLMNSLEYQRSDILDPIGYVAQHDVAYMIGVATREPQGWLYVPLPPGTFEIVWLPYPDVPQAGRNHTVLVRPTTTPADAFLDAAQFPCGVLYPNDPARRRVCTGDRDRLLAGGVPAADVVRLWLDVPAEGPAVELFAGDSLVRRFAPGTAGFHGVDVRAFRGQPLRLTGADAEVLTQAHLVDYAPAFEPR